MDAVDFIEDYDKITEGNKTATFFHANTMFQFAEDYHQIKLKLLGIGDVSQQSELLELIKEIANSKQIFSNTRHKLIAQKILGSNCG